MKRFLIHLSVLVLVVSSVVSTTASSIEPAHLPADTPGPPLAMDALRESERDHEPAAPAAGGGFSLADVMPRAAVYWAQFRGVVVDRWLATHWSFRVQVQEVIAGDVWVGQQVTVHATYGRCGEQECSTIQISDYVEVRGNCEYADGEACGRIELHETGYIRTISGPSCADAPYLYTIDNQDCDGSYLVHWQPPSGAVPDVTVYVLQEDDNPGFSHPTEVYRDIFRLVEIADHSPGTYYYRVKAINPDCSTEWSNVRSVVICGLAPPVLYPIDNTDCDGAYEVSWSSVSGATSYVLEEDDNDSFASPIELYSGSDTSTTVNGRSPGTYYYRVKACDAGRCSDWSNIEWTRVWPIPAAPTLDAIDNPDCGDDYIVAWSSVADATGYELQEDDDPTFSSPITVYQGPNTSKQVTDQSLGTFYYRVRAVNCRASGPWSNVESTYVLPPPTLNYIDNPDCDGDYAVSWSSVADATGYELQEDDDSAFSSPTTVYRGSDSSTLVRRKAPGMYYYRVRCYSPACSSAWSGTRSVRVWRVPTAPTVYPIENDDPCDGDYAVSWSLVTDATSYELEEDDDPSFSDPTTVYQGANTSKDISGKGGGTYYYRVKARNCRATSEWSNSQSVYVLEAPDLHPIANPDCDGDYDVIWSLVPDATTYEVEEDDDPSFASPKIIFQGPPFVNWRAYVRGRRPGVYYYRARAANQRCHSAWSSVESMKVWRIPDAPTLEPIDPNDALDGSFTVSWSSVIDGAKYELQEDDSPSFSSPASVYTGTSTSTILSCHAGGTWYFRVRASNCRSEGDWSSAQSVTLPRTPEISDVEATIDGAPGDDIGHFVSLRGEGIPVWNTFTAQVEAAGGAGMARVEFTLGGQTVVDSEGGNGWTARFDMSELPPGNVVLQVIAHDTSGLCSPPAEITVYTVAPPPWYGKDWVLNPQARWTAGTQAYTFDGRVPRNPPLYYRDEVDVPILGSLTNWFESDIHVTESFGIDGEWHYKARGVLKAEILSITAVDKQYPAQPILLQPPRKPEHGLRNYQWQTSLPIKGVKVTVLKDSTIAGFAIGPVTFEVKLSIDLGVKGSVTIQGRLHSDLTADQIRVIPGISPYADIELALEILFGVADVVLKGHPEIDIYLPIVYDFTPPAGKDKLYLDDPCLRFEFIVRGEVSILWGLKKWKTDPYTVFDKDKPAGCSAGLPVVIRVTAAEDDEAELLPSPALASDGRGTALAVWIGDRDPHPDGVEPEVFYALWDASGWSSPAELTRNQRFETDPQVAFLSTGEALAVWTQNELSRAEEDALTDINAVLAKQELYYSRWDGQQWSQPTRITHNDLPDGRAALAAGPDGHALLLWVRDGDADVQTRTDWRIMFSEWTGNGWSAPAPVTDEPGGTVAQPAIAYDSNGSAFAVFTHDADSDLVTVGDRFLAYATWDGARWSALSVRNDWAPGALAPVVAFDTNDWPLLVFTIREQDDQGRLHGEGVHDLLWSASFAGGEWQLAAVGESTKSAEPQVVVNPDNYAIVAFRGFRGQDDEGFGGDVVLATADLSSGTLQWSTPQFLTQDAARDWEVATTVDPVTGRTLILDQHESVGGAEASALTLRGPGRIQALADELTSLDIPFGKDLTITPDDIAFSNSHPQPGETVRITATVRNIGLETIGAGERPRVRIERVAPTTEFIAEAELDRSLLHNDVYEVVASWAAAGGLSSISVTLDPTDRVEELAEDNNVATKAIGQPPAPRFLVATAHPEGEAILLDWEPPETIGIVSYSIYRSTESGRGYQVVGDTTDLRYVDRGLVAQTTYYYVVTAWDDVGVESTYSDEASAVARHPVAALVHLPIVLKRPP